MTNTRWIDAHVHVWTDDRKRYKRTADRDYTPERFTPQDFLSHAQPHGVNRAVLIQMSFYGTDNSYMLDTMRAHPGAFAGVAIVDDRTAQPDRQMLDLAGQGVRGFRIAPRGNAAWLESPGMEAMWRCGERHRLAMCPLINPADLPGVDRMCGRFPETPVVIDHLARIGADGEPRDPDVRFLCGMAKRKNVFVKVSAFYALGQKQPPYLDLVPMIQRVFDHFGPRRLMWATDCPFQVQGKHTYGDSVSLIRDRLPSLSPEDGAWLLGRTADSVFFR